MKINVEQPESKYVQAVYLNGKRLAMCLEADDVEGYAIVALPPTESLQEDFSKSTDRLLLVGDPIDDNEWRKVKLTGTVEIIMATKNQDDGLDR
jgi:hypothetical protein